HDPSSPCGSRHGIINTESPLPPTARASTCGRNINGMTSNKMPVALGSWERQRHSQRAIIEILVCLGSRDTLRAEGHLIA
ncbi:hypothetical protein KUCAC02_001086, partial [Chaenocephalus aceratus]